MNKTLLGLAVVLSMGMSGCGGGGGDTANSSDSSAVSPTPSAPYPPAPQNPTVGSSKLLNEIRLADVATELTAQQFGLESWNPKAMVVHQDVLYVANDGGQASILRYDLKSKRALTAIHAQNISGIGQPWNRLYGLSVHNDRLCAASYSSNRVDVFDIGSGEPQFVTSLGTGAWSGDQHNFALVHPMSVAANDQYVFATDTHSRINVWKQSDVTASNHLKVKKYARLALPNCSYNCSARLETMDNVLYASFDNGMTYVYDLNRLEEGATGVVATKQENLGTRVFHVGDDGRFYAARTSGRVDGSALPNTQRLDVILPKAEESFHQYTTLGATAEQRLAGAQDIQVSQERLLSLFNGKIAILPLKRLQQFQSNTAATAIPLKQQQAQSKSYVLQDGETWETLTNGNLRHFYIDKILTANLHHKTLALQSYSAAPVRDLEIHAKLKDTEQWFVLAHLDHLDAFSQVKLNLNISENMYFPLVDGSGSIQLGNLAQFQQLPAGLLDLKISSKTDTHVQKLTSLKPKWRIQFGNYARLCCTKI
ncbi:beta-propeller fold lactonase family protein [Acinetobacter towneri]|uniref:beta-propeller fold lactonase family protein n=1 Tax=Acinetobacter towneri TaxID=202956 RepID=UPI002578DE52|nr:beta-propeller fold lactonase family protein [Acinetobacter towneri]MDM1283267.1 beta-propeller fold lactonase family protein [Acinetobacter towneri]